jgi:ankyrin repeat protein
VAAAHGQVEIVRFLIEQGADKNKSAHDGATPLSVATAYGHIEIDRFFVEQNTAAGATPLYVAAQNGHIEIDRFLVEHAAGRRKRTHHEATLSAAFNNH